MMEDKIYLDVWNWLTSLFPSAKIVQGYANNSPIPKNAIMMTLILEKRLDQTTTTFDNNTAYVFDSIQGTMQIDCYGEDSYNKARQISTMWHSVITCEAMENVQPLNAKDPMNMTFVNEKGQYEKRYMVQLELAYNTNYEQAVESLANVPNVDIIGIT